MGSSRFTGGSWFDKEGQAKQIRLKLRVWLATPRLLPHVLLLLAKSDPLLQADMQRWRLEYLEQEPQVVGIPGFLRLMALYPEFRNVFYHRMGAISYPIRWLAPAMASLYLPTVDIGPGLFIQHGFATVVAARRMGANCWINQQVTIGFDTDSDGGAPVLEDNVTVYAGAKIIGGIVVGANAVIGANAVVVKNVPPDCTVVGVPARIVRRKGIKVDEPL